MKAYGGVDIHVFLTSVVARRAWSASSPGHFITEKVDPVPIAQEVGWTPEPVWTIWRRENSWRHRDSNSDPSVVQSVASRYPGSQEVDYTGLNCRYRNGKVKPVLDRWFINTKFIDSHSYCQTSNWTNESPRTVDVSVCCRRGGVSKSRFIIHRFSPINKVLVLLKYVYLRT
jgi:hypothetical protein